MNTALWEADLKRLIAENPVTLLLADGREVQAAVLSDPIAEQFAPGGFDALMPRTLWAARADFADQPPAVRALVDIFAAGETPVRYRIRSAQVMPDRVTLELKLISPNAE